MNPGDTLDAEALLRHGAWLAQLARALVASDDEIDDVVQQTWTQALAAPPRHATNLRAWLGAIARNVIRAGRRSDAARAEREELAPRPTPPESPAELVARAELRRAVVDAVIALAEPYRSTLLLRFFEEQEVAAIARITKSPEPTVRTRIRRGIEQVREALQARAVRGGGDAAAARALLFVRLSEFARGGGGIAAAGAGTGAGATTAATTIAAGGVVMSLATKWTLVGAAALVAGFAISTWIARTHEGRPIVERASAMRAPQSDTETAPHPAAQTASRAAESLAAPPEKPQPQEEPAATEEPKGDCTITGVVKDTRGEPAAGIDVMAILSPRYTPPSIEELAEIAKKLHAEGAISGESLAHQPRVVTTTDGAGRFTLAGLSDEERWAVGAVDAEGACALSEGINFDAKKRTVERELRLVPVASVSGRVVTSDGTPIGGALVSVQLHRGDGAGLVSFRTPLSGPDAGRWSSGRQLAASFEISAEAPGFVRSWPGRHVELPPGRHDAEVEIVLEPSEGLLVSGPIVDESGATVDLFTRMKELLGENGIEDEELGRLDVFDVCGAPPPSIGVLLEGARDAGRILFDRGSYEFRLPPQWQGSLILTLKGRVVGSARVDDPAHAPPLPFLTPPPETRSPTALVVVTVVDEATGAAIDARTAGASVDGTRIATGEYARLAPKNVVVPEGAVAYVAPLDRVRVHASRPGFISTCPELLLTRADERYEVTVKVAPANCGIRGRALNHDDTPIAGAEVDAYRVTASGLEGVCVEPPQTGDDGSFHLRGLAAGEYVVVVAEGKDASAIGRAIAAESPPTVELRSPEGERTHFRVVGPRAPDGRTDLTFRIVDASGLPVVNHLGAFLQTSWQSTTFGASLVPGRYRVFVWFHGCSEGSVEFTVPAGGTIDIPVERAR